MANGQIINYQVNFNANTQNVKNALDSLQATLKNISNTRVVLDDGSIQRAKAEMNELSQILQGATNSAGKLDISKFASSLQASKKDLTSYTNSFKALGSQGQKAFLQLAQSISQAQLPLVKTNTLLSSMWVNLKNVAKWQISSTVLTGFTSGISNAINYVKELNTNLNNIRIVSGQSAEAMNTFAERANRAAKELATTTNEYTKASLIFYQQGLNNSEVKERTDATIKMAKVTGDAADQVSSYMTAIWNNFDNGSKSLEYYADVMTKLGAATASSTSEIAKGLEKFAGIAETVGLSYEYATSALATLVAETRQSPETVGTALKTIFSRLQGLKLGDTLEDGTNLNKYSSALATIGIQIKEQDGSLKDMDKILGELGNKWKYLSQDQQMALAQTVAGVRQYTQLITLMNNWNKMEKNVNLSINAEGELDKQFAIAKESWDSVQKEFKASMEGLYSELVPEELLIDFTKAIGGFVDALTGLIDGLGGMGTVLQMTFLTLSSKFFPQLLQGGMNILNNLNLWSGAAEKTNMSFMNQVKTLMTQSGILDNSNTYYEQIKNNTIKILEIEERRHNLAGSLTKDQQAQYAQIQDRLRVENQILETLYKQKEASFQNVHNLTSQILDRNNTRANSEEGRNIRQTTLRYVNANAAAYIAKQAGMTMNPEDISPEFSINKGDGSLEFYRNQQNKINSAFALMGVNKDGNNRFQLSTEDSTAMYLANAFSAGSKANNGAYGQDAELLRLEARLNNYKQNVTTIITAQERINDLENQIATLKDNIANGVGDNAKNATDLKTLEDELTTAYQNLAQAEEQVLQEKLEQANEAADQYMSEEQKNEGKKEGVKRGQVQVAEDDMKNQPKTDPLKDPAIIKQQQFEQAQMAVQGFTSALSGAYMMINSIKSLGSIWNNDELSVGEKITSTVMSLSMALGGLSQIMTAYQTLQKADIANKIKITALKVKNIVLGKTEAAQQTLLIALGKQEEAQDMKNAGANAVEAVTEAAQKLAAGDWVTIGVVLALLAAVGFGIGASISAANTARKEKQANADFETAEKSINQAKENHEKLMSYEEALANYNKETGEGKEALAEQATALAEAYNIEGAALANLTGNYEDFNRKVQQAKMQENNAVLSDIDLSLKSMEDYIWAEGGLEKGDGGNGLGGKYYEEKYDTKVSQKTANLLANAGLTGFSGSGENFKISGVTATEAIRQIKQARDILAAEGNKLDSSGKKLLEELDAKLVSVGEETYTKIETLYNAQEEAQLSNLTYSEKDEFGEITTLQEYEAFEKSFIAQAKDMGIAEEKAKEYLRTLEEFQEFQDLQDIFDELGIEGEQRELIEELKQEWGEAIFHPQIIPLLKDGAREELEAALDGIIVQVDIEARNKIKDEYENYKATGNPIPLLEELGITDPKDQVSYINDPDKIDQLVEDRTSGSSQNFREQYETDKNNLMGQHKTELTEAIVAATANTDNPVTAEQLAEMSFVELYRKAIDVQDSTVSTDLQNAYNNAIAKNNGESLTNADYKNYFQAMGYNDTDLKWLTDSTGVGALGEWINGELNNPNSIMNTQTVLPKPTVSVTSKKKQGKTVNSTSLGFDITDDGPKPIQNDQLDQAINSATATYDNLSTGVKVTGVDGSSYTIPYENWKSIATNAAAATTFEDLFDVFGAEDAGQISFDNPLFQANWRRIAEEINDPEMYQAAVNYMNSITQIANSPEVKDYEFERSLLGADEAEREAENAKAALYSSKMSSRAQNKIKVNEEKILELAEQGFDFKKGFQLTEEEYDLLQKYIEAEKKRLGIENKLEDKAEAAEKKEKEITSEAERQLEIAEEVYDYEQKITDLRSNAENAYQTIKTGEGEDWEIENAYTDMARYINESFGEELDIHVDAEDVKADFATIEKILTDTTLSVFNLEVALQTLNMPEDQLKKYFEDLDIVIDETKMTYTELRDLINNSDLSSDGIQNLINSLLEAGATGTTLFAILAALDAYNPDSVYTIYVRIVQSMGDLTSAGQDSLKAYADDKNKNSRRWTNQEVSERNYDAYIDDWIQNSGDFSADYINFESPGVQQRTQEAFEGFKPPTIQAPSISAPSSGGGGGGGGGEGGDEDSFSVDFQSPELENFLKDLEKTAVLIEELAEDIEELNLVLDNLTPGTDEWYKAAQQLREDLTEDIALQQQLIDQGKIAREELWSNFSISSLTDEGLRDTELEEWAESLFEEYDANNELGRIEITDAVDDRIRETEEGINEFLEANGHWKEDDEGRKVYDGTGLSEAQRKEYLQYEQELKYLEAISENVDQYLEQAKEIDDIVDTAELEKLKKEDNLRALYLEQASDLDAYNKLDNEREEAELERIEAQFSENDYSDVALQSRANIRAREEANAFNTYADAQRNLKELTAIPEELRDYQWTEAYEAALNEVATSEANYLTTRRDNIQEAIDDINSKYEELNDTIDTQLEKYQNALSKTEDFSLFTLANGKNIVNIDVITNSFNALTSSVGEVQNKITNTTKAYNEILNDSSLNSAEKDIALKEKKAELMSLEMDLVEAIKNAYAELTSVIGKYNDEISKEAEKLNAITEITNSYISTLETLGERFTMGDTTQVEAMQKLQKATLDMSIKNVTIVKEQRDAQQEIVDTLDEELSKYEEGTFQYNQLLAIRNEESSKLIDLETQLASVMLDSITQATELYEANIDRILTTLKDALAGENFSSLEDLQVAYDRAEKSANRYLDVIKQDYELSKLRRAINQQINSNTTEIANARLRDILADINKIEQDNLSMSEYDLQILHSKYELYKAQIALEEAQNNKSQVRLQRNSSGNWNYVFTADQGQIDQAAQQVEDAQYNIYAQSQEYLTTIQQNILTLQEEWTTALEEIYKDSSLTEEERIAKINATNEYYASQMEYYSSETQKALDITGQSFENTTLAAITGFENMNEVSKNTTDSIISGLADMEEELVDYESSVDEAMEAAGQDLHTFGDTVKDLADPNNKNGVNYNFNQIANNITEKCSTIVSAIQDVLVALSNLTGIDVNNPYSLQTATPYISKAESIKDSDFLNRDFSQEINDLVTEFQGLSKEEQEAQYDNYLARILPLNKLRNDKIMVTGSDIKGMTNDQVTGFLTEGKAIDWSQGTLTNQTSFEQNWEKQGDYWVLKDSNTSTYGPRKEKEESEEEKARKAEQATVTEMITNSNNSLAWDDGMESKRGAAALVKPIEAFSMDEVNKTLALIISTIGQSDIPLETLSNFQFDLARLLQRRAELDTENKYINDFTYADLQNFAADYSLASHLLPEKITFDALSKEEQDELIKKGYDPTKETKDYGFHGIFQSASSSDDSPEAEDLWMYTTVMLEKWEEYENFIKENGHEGLDFENNQYYNDFIRLIEDYMRKRQEIDPLGLFVGKPENVAGAAFEGSLKSYIMKMNPNFKMPDPSSEYYNLYKEFFFPDKYDSTGFLTEEDIMESAEKFNISELLKLPFFTEGAKYDTGGYTGEWGNEGKFAMLHEKELILNKTDTQKILDAVEIARMITGTALGQIGNLANAFSLMRYQMNPQSLQQDVHIEATFPGVQSAFEIETALKNIVNDVSQYAEMPKK